MASNVVHQAQPKRAGQGRHILIAAVLALLATPLVWLILSNVYKLPPQASTQAVQIDTLIGAHFWMIALLFSLIIVPSIYALVVFRRQEDDFEDAEHIHGNNLLEAIWIAIPTIVVLGFGVWGFVMLNDITSPQSNEMEIVARGADSWIWLFDYPQLEKSNSADLVVPVNRPIKFVMESIGDNPVLHSFWVPEWRVKQDVVPVETLGERKILRVTPNQIGAFKVRCAEICGTNHHSMRSNVYVVPQDVFDAWIAGEITTEEVQAAALRGS